MRSITRSDWTTIEGIPSRSRLFMASPSNASALLDADHLRLLGDHAVLLDCRQRPAHRILAGRIGDERDRRRLVCGTRIVTAMGLAVATALHDRLERNVLISHAARDGRGSAGSVDGGEPNIVAALVVLDWRALRPGEAADRPPEGGRAPAGGEVADVGDHRRRRRGAARA